MNFFKIFNLKVEKPSENDKDYSNKILPWGLHHNFNDYPVRLLKAITESPTASACMSTKTDYIRGGGFNIPNIEDIKVNNTEKFNSLHNSLSETVNKLKGIAIHVKRDLEGNIVELTKVSFEDCRLGIPNEKNEVNKIVYNPRWNQRDFKFDESIYYDLFTPDVNVYKERVITHQQSQTSKKVKDRKKYTGEIYWDCLKKDGYPYYPYAFSEYDIKAFETDSAFTDYDYNNIYNNFFLGGVFNVYGDPNEEIYEPYTYKDEFGKEIVDKRFVGTRGEIFNREMQGNFGGGENTGKWMVNWMQNEGQKLDVEPFPVNTNSDLFQSTQERLQNKISHITKVPPSLANIQVAGKLGDSQERLQQVEQLNTAVNIQQSVLQDAYNTLLPLHRNFSMLIKESIKIKKLNPFSFIPDKVWDAIPDADKRRYVSENYQINITEPLKPKENEL